MNAYLTWRSKKSDGGTRQIQFFCRPTRFHQTNGRVCAPFHHLSRGQKDNHRRINTLLHGFAPLNSDHASVVIYFIFVLSLFVLIQGTPVDLLISLPFLDYYSVLQEKQNTLL